MPLTGYRIIHVDAYSYRREFAVKDPKPKKKAAKAPAKRRDSLDRAACYVLAPE